MLVQLAGYLDMTYQIDIKDPAGILPNEQTENGSLDYTRLPCCEECQGTKLHEADKPSSLFWWIKAISICLSLIAVAASLVVWVGPLVINKVIEPLLLWEVSAFSTPVLGFILFVSLAIFPTVLLPSAPSMWVAGMIFGYGFGFLIIMAGTCLGMSIPYFVGLGFRQRIHALLDRWPKQAAILRLAGEGDWFHQFRAVTLLRISPFPYMVFNYAVVATHVKYGPYICGSLVGIVPEIFVTMYSGILMRSLADASSSHKLLSVQQIVYNVIGFCATIASTIVVTVYAKRALLKLHKEEACCPKCNAAFPRICS